MASCFARVAVYESSGCDELDLAAKGGTADAAIAGTAIGLDAPLPKLPDQVKRGRVGNQPGNMPSQQE